MQIVLRHSGDLAGSVLVEEEVVTTDTMYELVGYVGSILIIVSLAMSSIVRLRVINLIGAATFAAYGALIGSLPVVITNVIISGIDIYFLRKVFSTREAVTILAVKTNDPFVHQFLTFYAEDIRRIRPSFSVAGDADVTFLLLRDIDPAGVFIGSGVANGELMIDLDYVAPPYRDLRSGASLYGNNGVRFRDLGWNILVVDNVDDRQRDYFTSMGFASAGPESMTLRFDDPQP